MKQKLSLPFLVLVILLLIFGSAVHLAPLFDSQRLLLSITDDGYYMLTIARNIAIGNGMSIANGTIPSNGVQPLYTFLMAFLFWLINGDKILGIKLVVMIQYFLSILTFLSILKIGSILLKNLSNGLQIALFAAALWFCNPLIIKHSTNGLESGLYTLLIFITLYLFIFKFNNLNFNSSLLIGINIGLLFWVRNDAVFLVLAFIIYFLFSHKFKSENKIHFLIYIFTILLASLIVALPWIIFNKINFSNIIPVSGLEEFNSTPIANNISFLPIILTQYFLLIIPIPNNIRSNLLVVLTSTLIIIIIVTYLIKNYKNLTTKQKQMFIIVSIFLIELSLFYSVFFGNYYFLSRYLFPFSTFISLYGATAIFKIFKKIKIVILKYTIVGVALCIVYVLINKRLEQVYENRWFYFVEWVDKNVNENEWVGAKQSGTLGYFHDKTINLDGKVNPEALKYNLEGNIYKYVVDKKIDYLIDWAGLVFWIYFDEIKNNFDLIVYDVKKDLAVYRRKK